MNRSTFCGLMLSALFAAACDATPPSAPEIVRPVFVTTLAPSAATAEHRFAATLEARVQTELAFRTGGRVAERVVEIGDRVRSGEPIARLDPSDNRLALSAASDAVRAAAVDAEQSASDAQRFARLGRTGTVSRADIERQQARADAAAARLDQARRQLALARNRLAYATLNAPFKGIVVALRIEPGQVVGEGQSVATLAQEGEVEVVAALSEAVALQASEWRASATVGNLAQAYPLRLRELAPVAVAPARTVLARFAFDPPADARQWPLGSSATLELRREDGPGVTVLPASAVLQTGQGAMVWQLTADDRLQARPVNVREFREGSVVVDGLAADMRIVTAGAQLLDAGMKVRGVERTGLDAPSSFAPAASGS